MKKAAFLYAVIIIGTYLCSLSPVFAQEELPSYLKDRGPGVASSMFGTYVRGGDLIIYPYREYYLDNNREYKPLELGYGLDEDFRSRYHFRRIVCTNAASSAAFTSVTTTTGGRISVSVMCRRLKSTRPAKKCYLSPDNELLPMS